MADAVQSPLAAPESFEKKKDSSSIVIVGLLVSIVLIGAAIFLLGRFGKNTVDNNNSQSLMPSPTNAALATREELVSSTPFQDTISQLIIDDALVIAIIENPKYAMTEELENSYLAQNVPDFSNMSQNQAKEELRKYLFSLADKGVSDLKVSMDSSNKQILEQLLYMARLANSPYVSFESKNSWRISIEEGKKFLMTSSDFAVIEKDELKKYIEDFFKREEFTNL